MATTRSRSKQLLVYILLITLLFALTIQAQGQEEESSDCAAEEASQGNCHNKKESKKLKIIAIFSILIASFIGISLPLLTTSVPALNPERNFFVVVKALASGVILSTGFMHVLPDSWADLTSECLPENPWRIYPMTTFVAMVTSVLTMAMDSIATAYFKKNGAAAVPVSAHNHVEAGTVDKAITEQKKVDGVEEKTQLLRYRIIAQVLEMGIVVHSVVIGLSMGVTNNQCTIRPLIAAMCFHQLFEGMGLGGCIIQAEYKLMMKATMAFFFGTTTPFGIALGMAISSGYNENSPAALIVVGLLNAISAGLLIYMALVELLATDFMGPKLQASIKLQLVGYSAALVGMAGMSLMAKWA